MNRKFYGIISMAFLASINLSLAAGILTGGYKGVVCTIIGAKKYDASKSDNGFTNVAFSFVNKSPSRVTIKLANKSLGTAGESVAILNASQVYESTLDLTSKTSLNILDSKQNKLAQLNFAQGKTIYINWDGNKAYPQKGPLGGLSGMTDACYSLEKNVQNFDIEKK